jgi:hypothetical protein
MRRRGSGKNKGSGPSLGCVALALLCGWSAACGRSPLLAGSDEAVDAGALSDSAARRETPPDSQGSPTVSSCTRGPSVPASLAVLDDFGGALGMAVVGDLVLVGGLASQPIEQTPSGRYVAISVKGGDATTYKLGDEIPLFVQATGSALVYSAGTPQPLAGNWEISTVRVVRWDLQTDERLELAQPVLFPLPDYPEVATNSKGQVFWIAMGNQGDAIAFWDPLTRATSVPAVATNIIAVLADTSKVYWKGMDDDGYYTFSSAPIAGGRPSNLIRWVSQSSADEPDLLGIDDVYLYYALPNRPASGVSALPKDGSTPGHAVVPNATVGAGLRVDETHLYWAEGSDGISIRRATKSDGRAETLSSVPGRWVQALAIDDCNVYWVVANPFEVFFRSK